MLWLEKSAGEYGSIQQRAVNHPPPPFNWLIKGTVQRDFSTPVSFTKRFILVSIDMPKSDFKIDQIFEELFELKLSKNQLPAVNYNKESKTEPQVTHIFDSFEMFLVSSTLLGQSIFCFIVPRKEEGVLQSF